MNEYIQAEAVTPRKRRKNRASFGKMFITFMVLNIALTALMNIFAPKAISAAVCPTISFLITFQGLFRYDFRKATKECFGREKNSRQKIMSATADSMFAVLAVTLCLGLIVAVTDLTGIDIFSDSIRVGIPLKGFGGVVYGVYMCLICPVIHELMFRGAVMKSLEERGENTAVLVSAVLYGLLHGVYITSIYAFVMGIVFAKASLKAKSLKTVIKTNLLCSLLIYAVMFAVWKDWKFAYIPLLVVFGFFALMGLCRAILKKLAGKKKTAEPADFKVLFTLPVAGTALLMIAEDILFLLNK